MKVLFDINVILDVLLDRSPFSKLATELLASVERGEIMGVLSASSVTTIHYLATKTIGKQKGHQAISSLLKIFEVAPVNRIVLESALDIGFSDYEDAVLHEAAVHTGVQAIVSRDREGFKHAVISVYSPDELLKAISKK